MNLQCPICMDTFNMVSQKYGAPPQRIAATLCGHTFHQVCLFQWIDSSNSTCPECRRPLQKKQVSFGEGGVVLFCFYFLYFFAFNITFHHERLYKQKGFFWNFELSMLCYIWIIRIAHKYIYIIYMEKLILSHFILTPGRCFSTVN